MTVKIKCYINNPFNCSFNSMILQPLSKTHIQAKSMILFFNSRFHTTSCLFSHFKGIWNSTRPDMHYQNQFFIFFTSLYFIQPLHYSDHNALARSGCKNVLISFDSCPPKPRSLLTFVSVNLAFFGGKKKCLEKRGSSNTNRIQPTNSVRDQTQRSAHSQHQCVTQ